LGKLFCVIFGEIFCVVLTSSSFFLADCAWTADELTRYYHLNDDDLTQITSCRGEQNRLGFALQLTTVRYLGTFLGDPVAVPSSVLQTLSRQLGLANRRGSANLSVQQATLGTHHQNGFRISILA
jgi:Domain of unknown function (DUF4158)